MIAAERHFADRETLARHLAIDVMTALRQTIETKGSAILAVSGGTTPKLLFEKLSHFGIPWERVTVTLVDERQVPETSERSNARLVREMLLKDKAAKARFVPLFENPDAAKTGPLDAVILGMGNDGHTASFFPGGDVLAKAIDPITKERLIAITAPGAGEPRLTFTLPALLEANFICLHIEGEDKKRVFAKALEARPAEEMPIRAILRSPKPVTVYWCR
jgi:6-phosphogluconolactonase